MNKKQWKDWIQTEIQHFKNDLGHDRGYTKMFKEEIQEPIVVVMDSPIEIWDGWHRIAVSITSGRKYIPAIVGYPKIHK